MSSKQDDRIPLNQIFFEMYNPDGGPVSWAARNYYYEYYATPEIKKMMDHEDKLDKFYVISFYVVLFVLIGLLLFFNLYF